jgi:hypothetical protein
MSAIRTIRKTLRPVRRLAEFAHTRLMELPYRFRNPPRGSAAWLVRSEVVYGGLVSDVPRQKVSPLDGRTLAQLQFGGMTGGDRMLHNGYGPVYARYLERFLDNRSICLAEFGILKGTGLAIWCDLFPDGRVLGFDIDPSYFEANRADLARRGAFKTNWPEVHEYDQLVESNEELSQILRGQRLDIVIDDGLHSVEAIVTTWRSVKPQLSSRFVYFIEDYGRLLDQCDREFEGFDRRAYGPMTVVSANVDNVDV